MMEVFFGLIAALVLTYIVIEIIYKYDGRRVLGVTTNSLGPVNAYLPNVAIGSLYRIANNFPFDTFSYKNNIWYIQIEDYSGCMSITDGPNYVWRKCEAPEIVYDDLKEEFVSPDELSLIPEETILKSKLRDAPYLFVFLLGCILYPLYFGEFQSILHSIASCFLFPFYCFLFLIVFSFLYVIFNAKNYEKNMEKYKIAFIKWAENNV
jgi:hypothetical protein